MKIKLILSTLALVLITFSSQSQSYNFSTYINSYSELEGSISLNNGELWDDPSYSIPMGFNFQMSENTYSTININGDYGLGGLTTFQESKDATLPFLIAYGADIIDRGSNTGTSQSNISYLLTGEEGNQVLKIEWKNVGFYTEVDQDSISTSYTNFQLWLYEGTNNFEIHFGPNSISQPNLCYDGESGVTIGYVIEYDTETNAPIGEVLLLNGNPNDPSENTTGNISNLNGTVPENMVYLFEAVDDNVSVEEFSSNDRQFILSPNPATEKFSIESISLQTSIKSVAIITLTGQLVQQTNHQLGKTIDVSYLEKGVYLVQVIANKGSITTKRLVIE